MIILRVLLGLFVVWQLFFLAAANLVPFVPHGKPAEGELSDSRSNPQLPDMQGPAQEAINVVAGSAECWARATGQVQAWWLFAPTFPDESTFPAVELRWDSPSSAAARTQRLPPVRLGSVIEPADPRNYFHVPGSFDRLFHYEIRLGLIFWGWSEQSLKEHPDLWRQAVENRVRHQAKSVRAYLRWRIARFQAEHPELPPPQQAILFIRLYKTPPSGSALQWQGPFELPLARWLPEQDSSPGVLPIQMCDPVTGCFKSLPSKD
jgi:hypothetical protein